MSMIKTVSGVWSGPRVVLALVGILSLMSGFALAADTDIVITEIMNNPSALPDADGEWFEVHNTGATPVDLNGWTMYDLGTNTHTIVGSAIVPAGEYAVLGLNSVAMASEGVTLLYQYATFTLANGDDEVILNNASSVEIDRVEYDGGPVWPDPTGASMMWSELGDNNDGTNWSESTAVFGSGDLGTPGAANGAVASQPPSISDVYQRALLPEPGETVTVYATITDNDGTIASATLFSQVNGGGFTGTAMTIVLGDQYSATIAGAVNGAVVDYYVSAMDNENQTTTNPGDAPTSFFSYTPAPESLMPIATIQADAASYEGVLVQIQAQVFIPADYKADGTTISGYVQDGSDRGINIFGDIRSTGGDLLNDTSAIVKITGYVDLYFTTVEIVNYEAELVSTGNPELTPFSYSTSDAALPTNEGTFIKSIGPITAIATTGGSNPAHNFTINDGSGPVIVRIDDDVVVGMDTWLVDDVLEASGAGSTFSPDGQILVGESSKVTNHGQGPDQTPPLLTSAVLTTTTTVTLGFNEPLDPTTANTAGNYEVYETATPGNTITVLSAALQANPAEVLLTLAASASGTPHTVRVNNVEDVAGNPIAANTTMDIFEAGGPIDIVINEVMKDPYVLSDANGEWFEVYNNGSGPVDMNGWTIRDDGFDSHVIANGGPLIIGAGEYKVLVRNAASMTSEGVAVFYEYSGITMGNSDDELVLETGGAVIVDSIAWDDGITWPDQSGFSMQWTGSGDNNDGTTWEDIGSPAFGSGDRGTPGSVNDWLSPVPGAGLKTALNPNYPNPFNPKTNFSFSLDKSERVTLAVFDVRGNRVATVVESVLPAGRYDQQFSWDGLDSRGVPANSGTYFFRLTTESGFSQTGKMTLLK